VSAGEAGEFGHRRRVSSSPSLVAWVGMPTTLSELRVGRTLVGLSIACLVLCHGVLGALHLFSIPPTPLAPGGDHVVGHGSTEGPDEVGNEDHTVQHPVAVAYFAVLFGLLVGVTFLLRHAWRWCVAPAPRLVRDRLPVVVPILPRGPTATLLQVFRL
jgi:hypothetical protein